MTESQHAAILRRKMRAAPVPRSRLAAEDVVKRLVPRLLAEDYGVVAQLASLEEEETTISGVLEAMGEASLLIGLGPEGVPARSVAIADADFVTAVIEMETTRTITTIRREARKPTPVDVALAGGAIVRWTGAISAALSSDDFPETSSMRHFVDARAVLLAFDDGPARVRTFDFDFGEGKRRGTLRLLLPLVAAEGAEGETGVLPRERLSDLEVPLVAVLARETLPLRRLKSLEVGQVLDLSTGSLRRITLEAPPGSVIAVARLGQSKGHRAVRLAGQVEHDGEGAVAAPSPMPLSGNAPDAEGLGSEPTGPLDGSLGGAPDAPDAPAALPALTPSSEPSLPPLPADLLPDDAPTGLPPL